MSGVRENCESHHYQDLYKDFTEYLSAGEEKAPREETLKIDLHCHDHNSRIPGELWGRLLRLPETWTKTDHLMESLRQHGTDLVTVTNHNNADTCWELKEKGVDVLVGAEFTCQFPEYPMSVHVLTYGFDPPQEARLNDARKNIYDFLAYAAAENIPTTLAHPLFYHPWDNFEMTLDIFERFALLFSRFEGFNGQRGLWQNVLVKEWVDTLTPEKLENLSRKHDIPLDAYCRDPYRKSLTGGSDDHFAMFAGGNGTYLSIPDLPRRRTTEPLSTLALEALREGRTVPYGEIGGDEKLNASLLNYLCQVGLNMEDPGLIRLILHQGEMQDKIWSFLIGNTMMEVQRHGYTMKFFKAVDKAFQGRKIPFLNRLLVAKDYRPIIKDIETISQVRRENPEQFNQTLRVLFPEIFRKLNALAFSRLDTHLKSADGEASLDILNPEVLLSRMEVPLHIRRFSSGYEKPRQMSRLDLGRLMDRLSFPVITSGILAGASMIASDHILKERAFINVLARDLGKYEHPQRVLWLTDSLIDKNGLALMLQQNLEEISRRNLNIDFLVCYEGLESSGHLKVVPPVKEYEIPGYRSQKIRIPNLLEVLQLVNNGGYDRIVVSTEMVMGGVALYLKKALKIPVYFYMHTDWMDFVRINLRLEGRELDRVRRFLRAFYHRFDGVFVLNQEHREWLSGDSMGIDAGKVHLTAHWVADCFLPVKNTKTEVFPGLAEDESVLLFVGRLSEEKGVGDLKTILAIVRERGIKVRMVLVGTGPWEERLKREIPDGIFCGWVDQKNLPSLYSAADMLVLPSRFDTFGCVVLESLSCGTPVAAYGVKGPADIITHRQDGVLAETPQELGADIAAVLLDPSIGVRMSKRALGKARSYSSETILDDFLADMGIVGQEAVETVTAAC